MKVEGLPLVWIDYDTEEAGVGLKMVNFVGVCFVGLVSFRRGKFWNVGKYKFGRFYDVTKIQ
jgi:hypothetical protein